MPNAKKSRYGVYYDLEASPYEFTTPYGDVFKFRSAKKLEMYTRDAPKEIDRLQGVIDRNDLREFLPEELIRLLERTVYRSFYRKIEG